MSSVSVGRRRRREGQLKQKQQKERNIDERDEKEKGGLLQCERAKLSVVQLYTWVEDTQLHTGLSCGQSVLLKRRM
jgi:hypothetical protein